MANRTVMPRPTSLTISIEPAARCARARIPVIPAVS